MTDTIKAAKTPVLSVQNFVDTPETTTDALRASPTTRNQSEQSDTWAKLVRFVCLCSADQSAPTLSVVHQQLFLINPGAPRLLPASPQHVSLCLHTLISLVSVQNVPRTVISESMCPSVPSFIFPSLCHKSQRSSWNQGEKLGDQSRPTPEQTDWANGPAAFSSPQIISGARECSQSSHDDNAKAC